MVIVLSLESVCSGGGHATIGVTVDGGAKKAITFDIDEIRGPVDDRDAFIANIIKLSMSGLTRLQARNKLQSGVTITL